MWAASGRYGELVRLSYVEDGRLIWIAKAQGSKSNLRYDPITGHDVPLHVTAMGKAWLDDWATLARVSVIASLTIWHRQFIEGVHAPLLEQELAHV